MMPRDVYLLKESKFTLVGSAADLQSVTTAIRICIEQEGEISRVIERMQNGSEHSYGREKLRAELGEPAWRALLTQIGATS